MVSKVITNDLGERKDFKVRAASRVSDALDSGDDLTDGNPTVIRNVEVPSNFFDLSDAELYGIVKYQALTPEQVREVIEQLRGRAPGTAEFRITLQSPVAKAPEILEVPAPVPVVSVELPMVFKSYRPREQFLFLSKERALSPEQANDILDLLAGKAPLGEAEYAVRFVEKDAPEPVTAAEAPVVQPLSLTLPHWFTGLRYVHQEMVLTKDYRLALADARDVLAVVHNQPVDREIHLLVEEPPVQEAVAPRPVPVVTVEIPMNFETYKEWDQFLYLNKECALDPEQANELVAFLGGKVPNGVQFNIRRKETVVLPDPATMPVEPVEPLGIILPHDFRSLKYVSQEMMLTKDYGLSLTDARDVLAAVHNKPVSREVHILVEEPPVQMAVVPQLVPTITIDIPSDFESYKVRDRYLYLTKECGMTPDYANDLIEFLKGQPVSRVRFDIRRKETVSPPDLATISEPAEPLSIVLPHDFRSLKYLYQEMMLTKDYGLSLTDARDVLAAVHNKPVNRQIDLLIEQPPVEKVIASPPVPIVTVDIPTDFETYKVRDQYLYLTKEGGLDPAYANDLIESLKGQPVNRVQFDLRRKETVSLSNPAMVSVKPAEPLNIILPHDFSSLKYVQQEIVLTKDYGLSLADARDVLAAVHNKPLNREVNILVEEPPLKLPAAKADLPEVTVELPANFARLIPQDRYLFLKTHLHLTGDQANDVLAVFNGGLPLFHRVTITHE